MDSKFAVAKLRSRKHVSVLSNLSSASMRPAAAGSVSEGYTWLCLSRLMPGFKKGTSI